jgi:hypothetical protein
VLIGILLVINLTLFPLNEILFLFSTITIYFIAELYISKLRYRSSLTLQLFSDTGEQQLIAKESNTIST